MGLFTRALCYCALCLTVGVAWAQGLDITDGWVRLMPANLPQGGYFTLRNSGDKAVTLVGASAPGYGKVMLHRTVHKNGVVQMVHVESITVNPGDSLVFAPGDYHIMLMQPHNHLKPGDKLPVTLIFADGSKVTGEFEVRSPTGQ